MRYNPLKVNLTRSTGKIQQSAIEETCNIDFAIAVFSSWTWRWREAQSKTVYVVTENKGGIVHKRGSARDRRGMDLSPMAATIAIGGYFGWQGSRGGIGGNFGS